MSWLVACALVGCVALAAAASYWAWYGLDRLYRKIKVPTAIPADRPRAALIEPEWLREHVEWLESMTPRSYEDPVKLGVIAGGIQKRFRAAGAPRTGSRGFQAFGQTYYNVVAQFGPPPRAGAPILVVGAHYDSCGDTPGADDNASGVAGLIELTRLMAQYPPPPIAVEIVAYCLEEPPAFGGGNMGSAHHARSLKRNQLNCVGAIVLEMIGCFRDEPGSQHYPDVALSGVALKKIYPDAGNFIGVVGRWDQEELVRAVKTAMQSIDGVPVEAIAAPKFLSSASLSDHRSYWDLDMPAVMITDTAFYRNGNYHQKSDTADTLDYEKMAAVVEQVHAAVRVLAQGPIDVTPKQRQLPAEKGKVRQWSHRKSSPSSSSACSSGSRWEAF